jgi:hypothetical protein
MRIDRKRKPGWMVAAALAGLTGAAALLGGCPGTIDDKTPFLNAGACPDMPTYFAQSCTMGSCHGDMNPAAKLDLKSPDLGKRVAGQPATFCAGGVLANPDDPESSVLFGKLTDSPPCGAPMPLGGTALDDTQLDCVLEWIATLEAGPIPQQDGGGEDADTADAEDASD